MNETRKMNLSRRDLIRTGFAGAGLLAVGGVSTSAWFLDKNRAEIIKNPSGAGTVFFNDSIFNYSGDEESIEGLRYIAESYNTVDSNDVEWSWGRLTVDDQVWSTKIEKSVADSMVEDDLEDLEIVVVDPDGSKENITLDGYAEHGRKLLDPINWVNGIMHNGRRFVRNGIRSADRCPYAVAWYGVAGTPNHPPSEDAIFEVYRYFDGAWHRSRFYVAGLFTTLDLIDEIDEAMATYAQLVAALGRTREIGTAIGTSATVVASRTISKGMVRAAGTSLRALGEAWPEVAGLLLFGSAIIGSRATSFILQVNNIWNRMNDPENAEDITPHNN